MLRAFSTLCCLDHTLQEVIDLALRSRMYGVEIRLNKDNTMFADHLSVDAADSIRQAFDEAGLTITDIGTGVCFVGYEPQKVEIAKTCIDFADAVGALGIRLFLGASKKRYADYSAEEVQGIAKSVQELCDYAADKKAEIWLETHGAFSTGRSLQDILNIVQRPNAKVIWDVMHSIEHKEALADTVKILGSSIVHVHIKDGKPSGVPDRISYLCTDLGKGCMPIAELLRTLRNMEFRGFLSLEWEAPWREELQALYPDKSELLDAYHQYLDEHDQKAKLGNFPLPPLFPCEGHPRVLFTATDIPEIQKRMHAPQNADAYFKYRNALANHSDVLLEPEIKEIFQRIETDPEAKRLHRHRDNVGFSPGHEPYYLLNSVMLNNIECRAFCYIIEGDADMGRSAIDGMMTYFRNTPACGYDDVGQILFTAAEVYDWCYPLLSTQEKSDYIALALSIAERLEMGWPPILQNSVSGHGVECTLFRDLFALGIAMFDENRDIYDIVAARLFWDHIPARRFFYASHMNIQGSHYTIYRAHWEYFCTALLKGMGMKNYFGQAQGHLLDWQIYARRPDGYIMYDGDENNNNQPLFHFYDTNGYRGFALGASLYQNPYYQYEFLQDLPGCVLERPFRNRTINPVECILLCDPYLKARPHSELPLVKYFPSPKGGVIARTGWGTNRDAADVICEMKINEYWSGNHQHMDAGAFQIYYKGPLATDSGYYQAARAQGVGDHRNKNNGCTNYHSGHDFSYNKRSIAHNTMLVYDPNEVIASPAEMITNDGVANDGGQHWVNGAPDNTGSFREYTAGDKYHIASVTGYKTDDTYTCLMGDLTKAYTDKVRLFERTFVFLDLRRAECPAALIVFDKVVSRDPSFKKYWLCHGMNAPEVKGNRSVFRVTENGYNGMMTVDTLLPQTDNTEISAITDPADFDVFGAKFPADILPGRRNEGGACRICVSPKTPREEDLFLNVLQMSDADKPAPEKPELIETDCFSGALLYDTAVLFVKSTPSKAATLALPRTCDKLLLCGISGSWCINGQSYVIPETEKLIMLHGNKETVSICQV